MALHDFSVENCAFEIFDREITDWGQADPPLDMSPINEKGQLITGLGGDAVAFNNHQRWRVTINLMPGSDDTRFIGRKVSQGAVGVEADYANLGSGEQGIFREGMYTNRGGVGRGGPGLTDDQYIFDFNKGNMGAG
ncbi:virion structural protein [Vibrio phage D81]